MREYTHTLRLKSELFDLRVGYANYAIKGITGENFVCDEYSHA